MALLESLSIAGGLFNFLNANRQREKERKDMNRLEVFQEQRRMNESEASRAKNLKRAQEGLRGYFLAKHDKKAFIK